VVLEEAASGNGGQAEDAEHATQQSMVVLVDTYSPLPPGPRSLFLGPCTDPPKLPTTYRAWHSGVLYRRVFSSAGSGSIFSTHMSTVYVYCKARSFSPEDSKALALFFRGVMEVGSLSLRT
jgi:hypothetical protein